MHSQQSHSSTNGSLWQQDDTEPLTQSMFNTTADICLKLCTTAKTNLGQNQLKKQKQHERFYFPTRLSKRIRA